MKCLKTQIGKTIKTQFEKHQQLLVGLGYCYTVPCYNFVTHGSLIVFSGCHILISCNNSEINDQIFNNYISNVKHTNNCESCGHGNREIKRNHLKLFRLVRHTSIFRSLLFLKRAKPLRQSTGYSQQFGKCKI